MAKRSLSTTAITISPYADTAAFSNNGYCGILLGANATQRTNIIEVYCGGQASASSVEIMLLSHDSTAAGTLVAGSTFDQSLDASTSALAAPVVVGNSATTQPQRSVTAHLLNLTFNAFGGIVRWVAAPGEEISMIGNTQPLGEISFSGFTGSGAGPVGSHIIYETF